LTKRKNLPRATSARTSLKKKPALPLARAERKPLDQKKKLPHAAGAPARSAKPFDQKRKHPPRHQREMPLKKT